MGTDSAVLERLAAYGYGEDVEYTRTGKLRIDSLKVPGEFQRKLRPRRWGMFVPALFGRIIVAEVNGISLTVDGQHRLDHAVASGMESIPAILYRGMTMRDAAAMFDILNSERVALNAADEFRSSCWSEDTGAMALDTALLSRGLDGWCKGRGDVDLRAISSVRKLNDDLGLDHTTYTLDVIGAIWPWAEVDGSPHVRIVRGFGQFLRPMKRVTGKKRPRRWNTDDRDLLVDYIRTFYPEGEGMKSFLSRAEGKVRGGGGGGGSLGMELLLGEVLNKARRRAKAPA